MGRGEVVVKWEGRLAVLKLTVLHPTILRPFQIWADILPINNYMSGQISICTAVVSIH